MIQNLSHRNYSNAQIDDDFCFEKSTWYSTYLVPIPRLDTICKVRNGWWYIAARALLL